MVIYENNIRIFDMRNKNEDTSEYPPDFSEKWEIDTIN